MNSLQVRNRSAIHLCFFMLLGLAPLPIYSLSAQSVPVPISPEHFELEGSRAAAPGKAPEFVDYMHRRAIYLPAGVLAAKGANFRDGIVEADLAGKSGGLFVGIAFRVESEANMEIVYLRPFASDTMEAVQYTPRLNGDAVWQLLNSRHEKARAHLPENQWIHMKILVVGRSCKVFLNHRKTPTLIVTNLRRGDSEGGIALWALGGGGYFSNLSYKPFPKRGRSSDPPPFERAGLLSSWELSPAFDAADVDANQYPPAITSWQRVHAEVPGFVLVNRYRTSPAMFPMPSRDEMQKGRVKGSKVVFARTHIFSTGKEEVLHLGYSDEIVVYLNRKPIFSGKNALSYRDGNSLGTFGLNDHVQIHLHPGDNELLVAVTEYNGGWAFECDLSAAVPDGRPQV